MNNAVSMLLLRMLESSDYSAQVYNAPIKEFLQWCVEASVGKAPRHATVTVGLDTPIDKVIETLAVNRVHRVYVVDDKNDLCGVISVSDIVKQMVDNDFAWPRDLVVSHIGGGQTKLDSQS
jgi:CBS-domain-containing membrane protein